MNTLVVSTVLLQVLLTQPDCSYQTKRHPIDCFKRWEVQPKCGSEQYHNECVFGAFANCNITPFKDHHHVLQMLLAVIKLQPTRRVQ